uniref:Uncharacterized protein n=1 Tax=Nelumbo nucifera TaxID=4432 RepID=A0A822XZD7_NELNU|nr:TPA_asm: hypothetical protein HUJ06_026044 [Nelumbo nucifera]
MVFTASQNQTNQQFIIKENSCKFKALEREREREFVITSLMCSHLERKHERDRDRWKREDSICWLTGMKPGPRSLRD